MKPSLLKAANTLIFLTFISVASAQGLYQKTFSYEKTKEEAITYFDNHQYSQALDILLSIKGKSKREEGMINYLIGMCYMSSKEKEKALSFLLEAERSKSTSFVLNYYLGKAYFDMNDYNKAIHYLSIYYKTLSKMDGIVFKPYTNVPEEHLVHYNKTPFEVFKVIKICEAKLSSASENKNIITLTQ